MSDTGTGKPHIMMIEARFYEDIADLLAQGAIRELESAGATYESVTVSGALEIPVALQIAHLRKDGGRHFDAFVALGCVIRGETAHYDIVCNESAAGLARLALKHNLALGNGVLTCDTHDQALERADPDRKDKGGFAARAALDVLKIKKKFKV